MRQDWNPNYYTLVGRIVCIAIAFALVDWMQTNHIIDYQSNSPTFNRQIEAAKTLPWNPLPGITGFWHWQLKASEVNRIYLSFPSFAYAPLSILMKAGITAPKAVNIMATTFFSAILLAGFQIAKRISTPSDRTFGMLTGLSLAWLLAIQPPILNSLTDPNWEESFIVLSLIGMAVSTNSPILGFLSFFLASICCPTAGLAASVFSLSWILNEFLGKQSYKIKTIAKEIHIGTKKAKLKPEGAEIHQQKILTLTNQQLAVFGSVIGFIAYLLMRAAFQAFGDPNLELSGTDLLTRMGLSVNDTTYYGGVISILRVALPVSGIDPHFFSLSIKSTNAALLLAGYALLWTLSMGQSIRKIIIFMKGERRDNILLASSYFLFVVLFIICLFPQWAAVHFRYTARLLSPCIAIATWSALISLDRHVFTLKPNNNHLIPRILLFTGLNWILGVEFARFFLTWNMPFHARL